MGITYLIARFPSTAPSLEEIVAAATRSSKLEIVVDRAAPASLYRYRAHLSFTATPAERSELFVYDADELTRFSERQTERWSAPEVRELAKSNAKVAKLLERIDSAATHSPDASRAVHLRGFAGEEGTLRAVLGLACESLGASLDPPLSDESREACAGEITVDELRRRHHLHRRGMLKAILTAPFNPIRPMTRLVGNVTRSWHLGAVLLTAFGLLALVVAGVGLYSVMSYDVAQRRHELGVRLALGARSVDVIWLIVRDGLLVVILGTAIGIALALAGGRWFGALLFEVSPRDPLVFAAASGVLLGVALAASGLPAFRASRADPTTALRLE